MVMGLVSGYSLAKDSDSGSFLVGHSLLSQDGCQQDSGRWKDRWHLLLTFPEPSGWWWLISYMFLTRTSCHNISRADGLHGACYARCPNPPTGKDKTSMTMQHAKAGKFIADSSQGPCCNQRSGAKSESPEPQFPRTFIGCSISNISSG